MRFDGVASPRPLAVHDYFPDLVLEGPDGPVHTASLAGQRIAILLFASGPHDPSATHQAITLLEAISGLVPVMLAGFARRTEVPERFVERFHQLGTAIPEGMLMGAHGASPTLFLLEPDGKIAWVGPVSDHAGCLAAVSEGAGNTAQTAPEPFAPVLIVRNALSARACRMLVEHYQQSDHKIEGRVGLSNPRYDPSRKRVNHVNLDAATGRTVDGSLVYTLLPMIERCFDFRATRRVAYKVSLYDAQDRGFFYPHRDNSDPGTDYRRYALSLALNDDWSGDGLSFPEFGNRRYRLETGSAIIFPVSLLHQVHPVTSGKRYVLLSFLYAEEGALSRRAAMKDPGLLDSTYPDAFDPGSLRAYDEAFARERRFAPKYASDGQEPSLLHRAPATPFDRQEDPTPPHSAG